MCITNNKQEIHKIRKVTLNVIYLIFDKKYDHCVCQRTLLRRCRAKLCGRQWLIIMLVMIVTKVSYCKLIIMFLTQKLLVKHLDEICKLYLTQKFTNILYRDE